MFRFLLKRKMAVGLFVVFIFMFGLYASLKLDRELFPPVSFDQAIVMIDTEDMPATDVEQFVTEPIEEAIEGINGIDDYYSTSMIGSSTIMIDMEQGLGKDVTKDIESTVHGLREQLHGVKDVFIMQASTDQQYELFMDISGGDLTDMTTFAETILQPRLEQLPEVREVEFVGLEEKEVVIELHTDKLEKFGLQQHEVVDILQQTNINESIGELTHEKNQPSIRWDTSFTSIKDIQNISIPMSEGMKKLNDLATVEEVASDRSQFAWKNGEKDFILIQIGRKKDVTQIDMTEAVRTEIEQIKKEVLPEEIQLNEIAAQADYVSNSIDGITQNILIGGLIAIVVLLLFLRNLRATMIIALSIPASILLTLSAMWFFDYSFNLLTLIGLGLGIGMMVDASIVVLESVFKKKEQGVANVEAVISGTKEVATAVLASMLTTIVVFLPIALLGGEIGQMVVILAIVVAATLISSVLVAFTVIPTLSENFLKVGKKRTNKKQGIIHRYGNLISWMTKKKRRRFGIIGLFIVMFVSSLLLVSKIPTQIMPDMHDRYAEVFVSLESGTTPDEREEMALAIHEQLENIDDVDHHVVMDIVTDLLLVLINMTPEDEATMEQSEVNEQILRNLRELEKKYPIANVGATIEGISSFPVQIEISGDDYNELQTIGDALVEEIASIDGVVSAQLEASEGAEEVSIKFHEKKMEKDQVTAPLMYEYVQGSFSHVPVGEYVNNGHAAPIVLKTDISINDQKDLLQQKITTPTGDEEKLSTYVTLEQTTSPTQINHQNGERYIKVIADIEERDLGSVNRDVQQLMKDFETPEGYELSIRGDLEEQQEMAQDMALVLALAIFLVFVVMAIQFNSLKHPFIIMSIVPVTITGVIIGMFITQKELSVMSAIGIVMLVGIVLNNGILLIDRVKQMRNQGLAVNEALVDAGRNRLRPIFMTTLTTVGGMIPLALATDGASGYQSPLAVVIISGLLFSTLITLLLIPAIYLVFEDLGNGLKRVFIRKKKTPQDKTEGARVSS